MPDVPLEKTILPCRTMSEAPEKPPTVKVQTLAEFLRVVRACGLVEPERLEPVIEPWKDATGPLPEELPAALIDAELLTQWQLDQLRKGKHKGFMLGKYKLLRLLGAGGMSSVYLGENTTLRQQVAIKVLPVKRVEQSSYLARFEREAQAAFRLSHQNIARAFDLDNAGTIHFIVMEYVDGIDLHAKVKQEGRLDVRDAADFIRQAAQGLHHAHEEGVVHRDVKPANLILDRRGTVKILDLGLALGDDDQAASLTREHDEKVLGTADYLAPEQARDSHKADRRSDIYSLGCTLYYLLVGRAPFAKGALGERIRAHMHEPPPNLLEERSDVPPAIAELYFRMMEKDPAARQQTAQEVADALDTWLKSTAGTKPRELSDPPRRSLRRTPGPDSGAAPRRLGPPGPIVRSGPGSGAGSLGSGNLGASGIVRPGGSSVARGPAKTAPPTVTRGTPGSTGTSSTGTGSGTGIDLSSLSFEPASSGSGSTRSLPSITLTDGGKKAQPKSTSKPPTTKHKPPAGRSPSAGGAWTGGLREQWQKISSRQVAGLPLVFWIVAGVALLAAIGLGVLVWVSRQTG